MSRAWPRGGRTLAQRWAGPGQVLTGQRGGGPRSSPSFVVLSLFLETRLTADLHFHSHTPWLTSDPSPELLVSCWTDVPHPIKRRRGVPVHGSAACPVSGLRVSEWAQG